MKIKASGDHRTFWCPACDFAHAFSAGWSWNGDADRPTVRPSLLVTDRGGLVCHSYVTEGKIEFLSDCSHALAGKTIELPEWPYS